MKKIPVLNKKIAISMLASFMLLSPCYSTTFNHVAFAAVTTSSSLQAPINVLSPRESLTDTTVLLLWDKPANIYDISNFDTYVVYQNGVQVGETTKMGYSVSGLSPSSAYTFTVKTRDTDGNLSEASAALTIQTKASGQTINVEDYGAVGDGLTVNTAAIQQAINDLPDGGTIYIPAGKTFMSGALFLKSNMTMKIDGTLKGTTKLSDYPIIPTRFEGFELDGYASLLTLGHRDAKGPYNISNVVITGSGTIDGNGLDLGNAEVAASGNRSRGRAIMMLNAQNVYIKDLTVSYGPAWTTHFIYSDHITFDNVKLISKNSSYRIANGDGIDPDSSTHANIFNCYFHTGDDSVAIKSGKNLEGYNLGIPTEYIRVTDNVIDGSNGGYVIGSEMSGSVRHVLIQNNSVSSISWEGIDIKSSAGRGGIVEDVTFKDMTISKTRMAIRISANYSTNNDGDPAPVLPTLKDLHYENIVTGTGTNGTALGIEGLDGSYVQNVTMKNLNLRGTAGAVIKDADSILFDRVKVTADSGPAWTVTNVTNIQSTNPVIQPLTSHPNINQFDAAGHIITALGGTKVGQLILQLSSEDGALQTFTVADADGHVKQASEVLAEGDKLTSTAKIGSDTAVYTINLTSDTTIQLKASHPNLTSLDSALHKLSVAFGTTVADLLNQIESPTGTPQTYSVTSAANSPKASGMLVNGDMLVVTGQDGISKSTYQILSAMIFEGETTPFTTSGLGTSTAADALASGGSYRQFTGTPKPGNWMEYTINVPAAGTYDVSFGYKTNTNRGIVQLSIDGNAQGTPVDEYAGAQGFASVDLGNVTFSAPGDHKFRFLITGKNASSSAYGITFDNVKLTAVGTSANLSTDTGIQLAASHPNLAAVDAVAKVVNASNGATVAQVITQIASADGSVQSYTIADASGTAKNSGALVSGDKLVVTASDGITQAVYTIQVAQPAAPTATLTGTSAVYPGQPFDLTFGLNNLGSNGSGGIYAEDLTVNYDPAQLQFDAVTSLMDGLFVSQTATPGRIRIVSASEGASHAITDSNIGAILKLSFQANPAVKSVNSTVALSGVVVSDGRGVETQVQGATANIPITVVDKAELNTLIASAQTKYDAAVEGSKPGQYPAGSKEALRASIATAQTVADNSAATPDQVNQAVMDLNAALQSFLASVNAAIPGDVSGDGKISIGDLAIIASHYGETPSSPKWTASADLNGDGVIDISDLAAMAQKLAQ
ncbi:glycosyl hydrolase family 28 protein [Paenibacillus aceris]|uniref:Probable pectate lyase C n=1 Tax=Paenibacillus aceris TaxID=869555 RepID=A0ABS4HXV7_9BACL|nr:glycosyl hydrolase family 28 protein [Paenibacillus aceris]MBP1963383.1 polygalacturonase [Paenibacillus aceris]NHW36111.1 hypothetical protein [Paenibacillus aceris]